MSTVDGNILRDAIRITEGPRQHTYGSPEINLGERTASLWNAYLATRDEDIISGTDVCNLMILLKIARLMHSPDHYDSWLDIIGYASAGWELNDVASEIETSGSRIAPVIEIQRD